MSFEIIIPFEYSSPIFLVLFRSNKLYKTGSCCTSFYSYMKLIWLEDLTTKKIVSLFFIRTMKIISFRLYI